MKTKEFEQDYLMDADLEEIGTKPWRHGRRSTFVFQDDDGTWWRFEATMHHDEGMMVDGPITCTQVHEVERLVKVWESVP